jgi:biotin-(acetyl-CoA carboxylase) ligase
MLSSVFESTLRWAKKSELPCEAFDQIDSTNTRAKEAYQMPGQGLRPQALAGYGDGYSDGHPTPTLFLADTQTAGRGRKDHHWRDAGRGQSLALTFCYQLGLPPQLILTPLVGLALHGAASLAFPSLALSLKPPNDLFLATRKLAGVLVEVVARGEQHCLVVGLGLNVLAAPADTPTATYLCAPEGLNGPCDEVAWFEFLTRFRTLLERFLPYALAGRLPAIERAALLQALNAFPFKAAEYLDLTDEGDLVTHSVQFSWRDI